MCFDPAEGGAPVGRICLEGEAVGLPVESSDPGLKDFDPEAGTNPTPGGTNPTPANLSNAIPGLSGGNYPLSRVVTMGMTLTF